MFFRLFLKAEAKKKKQVVTEIEREHVMNGKMDDLVEHQRRVDEERDAQVCVCAWGGIFDWTTVYVCVKVCCVLGLSFMVRGNLYGRDVDM